VLIERDSKEKELQGMILKISETDSKILKALLRDGRRSFADIAEDCGMTKNKIWKRYKIMEKKGIITGATIQMNFGCFGYDALVTLLINVEAQQTDQIMEYIKKITEVRAYRQYNSSYNVRAVATLKDLNELDQVKGIIRQKLPTVGLKTYIWTDVRNIPENLNLTPNHKTSDKNTELQSNIMFQNQRESRIDALDMQIVEKLTSNGRAPFSEIAQQIGTSTDTIVKRYQKLRRKNAVKVIIQIDPNKIGYRAILDFNIAFACQSNSSEVVEALARIPDVTIITKTSGDYDLQVTALMRNVEQMFAIQDEFARTPCITKIETSARKIPTKWPSASQYISTF
jgi:Lrp/AsnC family transcriptional regulator for asnA, asnC and gidA